MEPVALVLFINNDNEILLELKEKTEHSLFNGQWSLLEGSMLDNGTSKGELVRGIMEDNFLSGERFQFFKQYSYEDKKLKQKFLLYVFVCRVNLQLLKIRLFEAEKIAYFSPQQMNTKNTPEIIQKIIKEYLTSQH
jgi:hypothetical protein